jgi:two-component system, NtrC family, response regulator HydG
MMARILVVDDDQGFRLSTAALLLGEGHEVSEAEDASAAAAALEKKRFDIVLMDLRMPGLDGIDFTEVLRRRGEGVPVLMVSSYGSVDVAVRALHGGVDDFLSKPLEPEVLLARIADLVARRPDPEGATSPVAGMVGRSAPMADVYSEIRQVAGSEATVLLLGETGTGKELAARAIHLLSSRRSGPFIPVNCAALAEGVVESELFGHVKGAFTGAVAERRGHIRAADGGTLFLDEVGDLPLATQQRLLRVLQEHEVVPVGSSKPIPVSVRLVAATHHDLEAEVAARRFREDLFFRLNVFRITMPPLRDRPGDIPLLVEHALRGADGDSLAPPVSPFAMRTLLTHRWPGNVRQLLAALESARIRSSGDPIQAHHLPEEIRAPREADDEGERYRHRGPPVDERSTIEDALRRADGVRTRAAALLGMSRTTLWRKLREYGIDPEG